MSRGQAGFTIAIPVLREFTQQTGRLARRTGQCRELSGQPSPTTSFSPDAAYHTGPRTGMRFLEGAPVFAVEVRIEHDYGPRAERAMKAKRADYFSSRHPGRVGRGSAESGRGEVLQGE